MRWKETHIFPLMLCGMGDHTEKLAVIQPIASLPCPCPDTCPTFPLSLSLYIYNAFNHFQFTLPIKGSSLSLSSFNPSRRNPNHRISLNQWLPFPKFLSWLSLPSSSPSSPSPLRRLQPPARPPLPPPLLRRSSLLASLPSLLSPSDLLSGSEVLAS